MDKPSKKQAGTVYIPPSDKPYIPLYMPIGTTKDGGIQMRDMGTNRKELRSKDIVIYENPNLINNENT